MAAGKFDVEGRRREAEEELGRTELDSPIKVRWTGYTRERIAEYQLEFEGPSSSLYLATMRRQKTQVVIETVEEAEAVRKELPCYDSNSRVWMNSSSDRALSRVISEIDEAMAERGWAVLRTARREFKEYVPADEVEERQEEVDEAAAERKRKWEAAAEARSELAADLREDGRVKKVDNDGGLSYMRVRLCEDVDKEAVVEEIRGRGYEIERSTLFTLPTYEVTRRGVDLE